MKESFRSKLTNLNEDLRSVLGRPPRYFLCPILYRDEDVDLCRAHIVNQAFADSDRTWTIQRGDVDHFFGAFFEAEFTDLQLRGKHTPAEILTDPELSKRFKPTVTVDGEQVEHYRPSGVVPEEHSAISVSAEADTIELALKMRPVDMITKLSADWQIDARKDVRLEAVVSLLKAAHLTMFEVMGYAWPLSGGGRFLGHDVLGAFVGKQLGAKKPNVRAAAKSHFGQFINMVRPVLDGGEGLHGTLTDRCLFVCKSASGAAWSLIVLVRTGDHAHAVLVPVFDDVESAVRFNNFLQDPAPRFDAHLAKYHDDYWEVEREPRVMEWPRVSSWDEGAV